MTGEFDIISFSLGWFVPIGIIVVALVIKIIIDWRKYK